MAITTNSLVYQISLKSGQVKTLIDHVSLYLEEGSFTAIIGPSGCGKSTLLKLIAGLLGPTIGDVKLAGYAVERLIDDLPLTIGYLPQFASFHQVLTVWEILQNALALRLPSSVDDKTRSTWLWSVIELTNLQPVLQQQPSTLSGGQLRRLALAEQLVGDPPFLFLDELTSGLDPHAEREMMFWLANLVKQTRKTVVLVTHSLSNLSVCDKILFLSQGRLIYDGPPNQVMTFFKATDMEHIYSHSEEYALFPSLDAPDIPQSALRTARPTSALIQFVVLTKRQWTLFFRDRGQLYLQILLIFSFPILVAVFAYRGLPEVRSLSLGLESNIVQGLADRLEYFHKSYELAALVSGLSMLQVILLALMGANNGAREIAKERDILFKEIRAGLSIFSYIASKFTFVAVLCALQSFWMTFFVRFICDFPGSFNCQFIILFLTTYAMGCTCIWFSAISKTAERASLLAIYSVGLQLPLSGAVLALPHWFISSLTQPLIAAYWGWSGYLRTLETFRHFDVVSQATKTEIAKYNLSIIVLIIHIGVSFGLTWRALERGKKRIEL